MMRRQHPLAERGLDLYETPPEAVRALLRVVELPPFVWEPASGKGAICRELRAAGLNVYATEKHNYRGRDPHILTGVDFFNVRQAPGTTATAETIVTNPPYQCADDFIRHGLTLCDEVIVLLRAAALEGAGRSDLIDRHLRQVFYGIERLPMMHRHQWKGPKLRGAPAQFCWMIFRARPRRSPDFRVRRISWREQ
jgi:hypothetical protein